MKTALLTLLLCAATLTSALAQNTTKLRVTNPQRAQQLVARGAKVIADYGSFQLLEAPAALASEAAAQSDVADAGAMNIIHLNASPLDTTTPAVKAMRSARAPFTGKRLHLVQFAGPIKPEWRDALEQRGARIVTHIPDNAYLIYTDHATLAKIQTWAGTAAHVQWEGAYADAHKLHPRAKNTDAKGQPRDIGTDTFAIQLVEDDEANAATLAVIGQHQLAPVKNDYKLLGYRTVIVQLPANQVATIAALPDVVSIQPYFKHRKFDERQDQIMAGNLTGNSPTGPGYLAWLAGKGFTQSQFDASGFIVDVTDSGIDNGTTSPGHFALYDQGNPGGASRVSYNRLEGTPNPASTISGCDGHGNLNGHIIGGYSAMPLSVTHNDAAGFQYGLGVCPFVKVGSSVIFDPDTFTNPNYPNLQSRAYNNGARVSGNSWGADTAGAYDVDAQTYDALVRDAQPSGTPFATAGNQPMVIVFASGNAGPGVQTVGSPGCAKNLISVGAAENVRAFGGTDGSGVSDTGANSANDIIDFSSRGPCADGRYKPDLVAPGTHVTGGVGQNGSPTTNGTGNALNCFNGSGVSGGTGGSSYFPSAGQQFYTASSGTSHSTPGIAGACALLRQYFINASLTPPSPAMTKAFLVNSARYMTGTYANDTLPSQSQGMGHVNLGTAFDGVTRILRDQVGAEKFTASGQARAVTGVIADTTKPFRVTLGWTDAPGSTTGNAYNNNLNLTVTIGGNTYKGNVFSGANSTTGGAADAKNNAESVFIPAGVSGPFAVIVTAADINSDGVPNEGTATDQDFALVIYNATETNAPVIHSPGSSITNESCAAPNGAIDPGETVTVNVSLQNVGSADTTNLIATLLATGGVTSPSGPQLFGALTTNGNIVTMPFTFTATGVCGSNLQMTLALTDGATNLGNVVFTFTLGVQATVSSENFDGVSAPALPAGWSTTSGAMTAWTTTTTFSDSAPNAAYSANTTTKASNALTSATIILPSSSSRLTFRHRYDTESSYDGGVLEIKIGAGAFADILTAGGSFVSGGYTLTLNSGNALGARQAWSGNNGGFTTVIVNLPAAAAGQSVQFRWRTGTDTGVAGTGWWVDSIAITAPSCCVDVQSPTILTQPQSMSVPASLPANFFIAASGAAPLSYQWFFNSNILSGATATNYFIASVDATNLGTYFVIVTNDYGSVTSSVATLSFVTPPVITTNPASLTIVSGGTANFSVAVTGSAPLVYQWQFNSTNIPGATTNSYSLPGATTNNAGSYLVIITNIAGAATSSPALLTVTNAPPGTDFTGILAGWDMSGQTNFGPSPMAPTTNAPNVTVIGLTRGAGVTTNPTAAARAWGGNGFGSLTSAAAITANDFATFSITANAGYKVSFTNVSTFAYRRSNSGPPLGLLQFQLGTGAFTDITNVAYVSTSGSGATLGVIDLSAIAALQNVGPGTNVNFRLVNYGTNVTTGNWYLYDTAVSIAPDFAVSGSVTSLTPPEPPAPPAVAPVITNAAYVGGQFQFDLTGTVGSNYIVLVTTNLADTNWNSIWTNPAPFTFVETNVTEVSLRFYRGRIMP